VTHFFIVMLNVIMLSVAMLNVIRLCAVILSVVATNTVTVTSALDATQHFCQFKIKNLNTDLNSDSYEHLTTLPN
jgi:hypothetical protein